MANSDSTNVGMVYLVGAGPGDPGMITLRAVECLGRADVVLFDYLVNAQLLTHARRDAEKICLGRHGQGRLWSQDKINDQLVQLARQGKAVVRLKGGDPAVFARGSDEAEHLVSHGIRYEIVPGITAALAAGSYAGIPITHRNLASAVALVTGQEQSDKSSASLDFKSLAQFPGTLVFYMGVTTAQRWTKELIDAGKPADTPTAIIQRCSHPDQQSIHCRLDEVVHNLSTPVKIRPPAIVIIGAVTTLAKTLTWFENRPLFGKSILITRPAEQSFELEARLGELGAQVLRQPAIEISEPDDWRPVDDALRRLDQFDWLVFSSSNGVRYFVDRLESSSRDLRCLGSVKLATMGPGTTAALAKYRLKADVQPESFRAESFRAETLATALSKQARGKRFLLVRASRGREVLADALRQAGGEVEQVVAYASNDVKTPDEQITNLLHDGAIDWVTITSSAIARSMSQLFGDDLKKTRLASISPITSDTLRAIGLSPHAEAKQYTMAGVVEAIKVADRIDG